MLANSSQTPALASLNAELDAAGAGLKGNDDLLRSVLSGCGDCIKILDLDGRLQFMSEGGKRVMEVDDFSSLKGCPWPDFWTGQGNLDASLAVEAAKVGETARFKGAANTAKGTPRYWDVQVSPIYGADGMPVHLLSISRDITEEWRANAELKDAAERQAVLTDELQHRIKNTLAMVGAIANQTMRGASVRSAREAFAARLMILSEAHDMLTQTSWSSAPIHEVVTRALAAHHSEDRRISVGGPEVELQAKPALALALAIHELATNATKYGALSRKGKVDVLWSNDSENGFRFSWIESGGPAVSEPSKKGFGSRLIERVVAADFAGATRTSYRPGGVVFELEAPMVSPAANSG
jgi:two-component sensor histidine kinase